MGLLSLFIRFVLEIRYFDWKNIEADDDAYSLHISLSGFWIVLCFVQKIYIPSVMSIHHEWDAELNRWKPKPVLRGKRVILPGMTGM